MSISKVVRRKLARYALEALVRSPHTVSEPLIRAVLQKVWRGETGSIRPMVEAVKRFSENTNRNCQERFLGNLVLKGLIDNQKVRDEAKKEGLPALHTILLSPTMRCNLNCKGCYSKNYQKKDDLSFEIMDRVLEEGKEIGVAFFTLVGGEPFLRDDLFALFERHQDVYFQVFTNATLLNEEMVTKFAAVGNVIIQFSVEGLKERDDKKRGIKHFDKVMAAMEIARKHRVPFGYSVCVTKENFEEVMGNEFMELIIERGALVGWYFLYMPVCGDLDTEPMPLPEQRKFMKERRDYIRANYPIFIIDFWNDAPYVGGCISAKYYCHINNFGDVEPCIFAHFAQTNIKNSSLREALNCELFREIRSRQPFDRNLFLPCPLIDNPRESRTFVKIPGVYPTHPQATTLIEDLKDNLDQYSQDVHRIYAPVWEEWAKRK